MNIRITSVAEMTLASRCNTDSKRKMLGTAKIASLTSIVAIGLDGAIGIKNDLPWQLKSDLRFFKKTTRDNIIVMGRKTFDSIGGCLPKRENLVLSRTPTLFPTHDGCQQAHSIGETLFLRNKMPRREAFVIGGAQIYRQFAPYVDRYLLTVVSAKFPQADAFFELDVLNDKDNWTQSEIDVERINDENADEYDFRVIELRHKYPEQIAEARASALREFQQKNPYLRAKWIRERVAQGIGLDEILSHA